MKNLCPKCKSDRDTNSLECPKCGIIFAKYEEIQKRKVEKKPGPSPPQKPTNKNLTQCKDCDNFISKNAKTCPFCGVQIKTIPQKITQLGCGLMSLGILLPIVFMVFIMVFGDKKPDKIKKPQVIEKQKVEKKRAEPYAYRTIGTRDVSYNDNDRMVYEIYLKTDTIPDENRMKATARQIWKNGNLKWDQFTVFMIFGEIKDFSSGGAYGVCEFTSSGMTKFFINDVPLQMLKLKTETGKAL